MKIKTAIERYMNAHNDIAKAFALKYYDYKLDWYDLMTPNDRYLHPICICDDYWSIEDMYLALHEDISKEDVHAWYSYAYELYNKWEKPRYNLYTYQFTRWSKK